MRSVLPIALALGFLGLSACTPDEPTEVMLVIDGEFATPSEIDHLDITVTSPTGASLTTTATFDASNPGFPRTVGVVPGATIAGDYQVDVVAKLGTTLVVRNRATFRFTGSQIRMLRVDLLRACVAVNCGVSRTCGEGGLCDRPDVSTTDWHGLPAAQFDAGAATSPIVAP